MFKSGKILIFFLGLFRVSVLGAEKNKNKRLTD